MKLLLLLSIHVWAQGNGHRFWGTYIYQSKDPLDCESLPGKFKWGQTIVVANLCFTAASGGLDIVDQALEPFRSKNALRVGFDISLELRALQSLCVLGIMFY